MNIQGFPSMANRNSGSNRSLFPTDTKTIAAGLPKVKFGMDEIPLFVTVTKPPKLIGFFVLSVFCEKVVTGTIKKIKSKNESRH